MPEQTTLVVIANRKEVVTVVSISSRKTRVMVRCCGLFSDRSSGVFKRRQTALNGVAHFLTLYPSRRLPVQSLPGLSIPSLARAHRLSTMTMVLVWISHKIYVCPKHDRHYFSHTIHLSRITIITYYISSRISHGRTTRYSAAISR